MSGQAPRPTRPAGHAGRPAASHVSRLVEAVRALRLATAVLSLSSQFAPLGDNGELLADLAARARAARDLGA
jgi:hypothetical protein